MDKFPQALPRFLSRQMRKRHLAGIWAELAGLRAGMTVLDIGSGPGILAAEYARLADPGVVYALEPRVALHLRRPNLIAIRQDAASAIALPRPPDVIFLTDMLHHAAVPLAVLRAVHAVCRPETRILLAEFDPAGPGRFGPPPERRMPKATLLAWLADSGFEAGPVLESADEHYAVLARMA